MITLSSVLAAGEAIDRLIHPRTVTHLWIVAVAAVVGFAGNEIVARYRIQVGRRIGSAALVADGLHARTDGFTSLAVLFGAGGVALGWPAADPIIGLVITVAILGVLRSAVRQVGARLMDAVDPALVDQATAAVTSVPGIRAVRELRIRWIGHTLRAEVDATVDPDLTVTQAHDIAHHAETHLLDQVRRLTAATIHTSPTGTHAESQGPSDPDRRVQATSPQTGHGSRNACRILTGDVDDLTALTADMKNVSVVPSDDPTAPGHGLTGLPGARTTVRSARKSRVGPGP
jgi:cation diffusion facilitator family transporter